MIKTVLEGIRHRNEFNVSAGSIHCLNRRTGSATATSDQANLDGDELGDACDSNADGDSVVDIFDQFPQDGNEWINVNEKVLCS